MGGDGFLITTIGPDDADISSVVDVKTQTGYTGTAYYFFWLADFNKYMIYTSNPDAWYESTDAVTWVLSTDTRFTTLDDLIVWGNLETVNLYRYPEHRGVAWTHYNGSTDDLVITK